MSSLTQQRHTPIAQEHASPITDCAIRARMFKGTPEVKLVGGVSLVKLAKLD